MNDLDINYIINKAIESKSKMYRKIIYWFCKRYFHCDIHPNDNIHPSVKFAHNGLGVVINEDSVICEDVIIQHHVTIGSNEHGVPIIGGYSLALIL
ncbi:hypothetical protein DWZ37_05095 [Clostridiaceae bacterium AF31-3BH]|nr:hypothetical protein DWZ37_05095 [Clostridiaceae bacterium AF31-3BH]